METSTPDFCAAVRALGADDALKKIRDFVVDIMLRPTSFGRVLSCPALDNLCQSIGAQLDDGRRAQQYGDHVVFLATELAKSGGHTRLMGDLIAAENSPHTILLSDIENSTALDDLRALLPGSEILVAPKARSSGQVVWLQQQMQRLKPRRAYVVPHHFDAVTIAAAQPRLSEDLVYIHNCDHMLALGVHLRHARHIDLHAKGYWHCREQEGVRDNVMWPLTVPDRGRRRAAPKKKGFTTATCGGFEKFEQTHMLERMPYNYRYEQIIPLVMATTGGAHIHIGALSDRMLGEIRKGLAMRGCSPIYFMHVQHTPDLWSTLIKRDVDLYLTSFPTGGGRATIEALGAGVPIVAHSNYQSPLLGVTPSQLYDGCWEWRTPEQLCELLAGLTRDDLAEQGNLARAFYEAHHRPELLSRAIAGECRVPPRPHYLCDHLQRYLDERAGINAAWEQQFAHAVREAEERRDAQWKAETERRLREALDDRDRVWSEKIAIAGLGVRASQG